MLSRILLPTRISALSRFINASLVKPFSQKSFALNNQIDKKHLEDFQKRLRSEVDYKPPQAEEDPEKARKLLHTKFYREVGKPFLKVVIMTFATYYSLRLAWEYLEATDEDSQELESAK